MNLLNTYRKEMDRQSDEIAFKNSMIITMFIVIGALLFLTFGYMNKVAELNDENNQLNTKIEQLVTKNNTLQADYSQSERLLNGARLKLSVGYENAVNEVIQEIRDTYYIEDIPLTQMEQQYIYRLANEYDLDYNLVIGLIALESNFDKDAIGQNKYSQDYSLFQVNSLNQDWLEKELDRELDLMNFKDNVDSGMWLLNYYMEDNIYKGLTNYNKGKTGTRNYYNKHLTYKSDYAMMVLDRKSRYE